MEARLKSCQNLNGTITIPGDKSVSHRAVMLGSIAQGVTKINNFLDAGDPWSTVNCMREMGAKITREDDTLLVEGTGLRGLKEPENILDAGNSGTTIRLLSGILAGQDFYSVINGDESLRKRPMVRIAEPLRKIGAKVDGRADGNFAPLTIRGGVLNSAEHKLNVASAQVKSALLLAGLYADGETSVVEPGNSRDHTERMLSQMGVNLKKEDKRVVLSSDNELQGLSLEVPGDFSSAAFFIIAASIKEGSEIRIKNVGINSTRTGLLSVLSEMGAQIQIENQRDNGGGEPVADLIVKGSRLQGVHIGGDIIPTMIDEIPVLAVAASIADGKTSIRNAAELKVKESNRLSVIAAELNKMGADIKELPDGLEIKGNARLKGAECDSYNDHRIAMALAVAALAAEGETAITSWECVDISFPKFLDILKNVAV